MRTKTFLCSLLWLTFAACKTSAPSPADEVVAKVNNHTLTRAQFQQLVERNLARYTSQGKQLPAGITARIEESVLRRLIDDTIIEQKAEAMGLKLTDSEVDAKFKEHKERFRTEQAFTDYLQRSNNTETALREDLRKNMIRDQVVDKLSGDVTVSAADVETYYAENMKHFVDPEQMRVRRILVLVPENADAAQKRAAQQEAKRIHDLARRPHADFSALAREHGKGPEASRDGDLSIVVPGRMPELDKVVAAGLKPGQISDVVQSEQGYAILRLEDHRAARQKPIDEVRDSIRTSLEMRERNERRQTVLHQLKSEAAIEVFVKFDATPPPPVSPAAASPMAPASATAPGETNATPSP